MVFTNQEDSLLINQASLDRGLYNGSKYTFEISIKEDNKEVFGIPDITKTLDTKATSYDRLTPQGYVPVGTVVNKGDIIIGKYAPLPEGFDKQYQFQDMSVKWQHEESAIVTRVVPGAFEDGRKFIKIGFRKLRGVQLGDKFCRLPTAEVLTNKGWISFKDIDINACKVATMRDGNLEYVQASNKYEFDHNGQMYHLKTQQLHTYCTLNHNLYVKKRNSKLYDFSEAKDVYGKCVSFMKDVNNNYSDLQSMTIGNKVYPLKPLLALLGLFINDGNTVKDNRIILSFDKLHKKQYITDKIQGSIFEQLMNICENKTYFRMKDDEELLKMFQSLDVGASNKYLPEWIWSIGQQNCRNLLDALINGDGSVNNTESEAYYTSSHRLANDVQRLALHGGYSACIKLVHPKGSVSIIEGKTVISQYDGYAVRIVKSKNKPTINHGHINGQLEEIVNYNGKVYCIEVPDTHLFYCRESFYDPPMWDGNSARSGQKGVVGLTLCQSMMPFDENGVTPSIIMNPHAIPSRMTLGQLLESLIGNWCARRGTHTDGTIFNNHNIESVIAELERMGYKNAGYHLLYSGFTGEYMNTLIFQGPTYYQRLQKFTSDTVYAISKSRTDELTRQPLTGKARHGSLRLGEMEVWVLLSHGSMRFLSEKMYNHSDGFYIYICATCGNNAIVNHEKELYICKTCKGNADIREIPSAWAAGPLASNEIRAMNIGMKVSLLPYRMEVHERDFARITKKLESIVED